MKYDSIINMPRHTSKKHPIMDISDRAAQFAPFAALTGYGEAINEAGRVVDKKKELSEDEKDIINTKLNYLIDNSIKKYVINVIYFVPDKMKDGGKYASIKGVIKKMNQEEGFVVFENKEKVLFNDIVSISGEIFDTFETPI